MKTCYFLFLASFCIAIPNAWSASETFEIYHLPLIEAENAVKTQLSSTGSVAKLPSRRLLIVNDDKQHIQAAAALLKRLDVAAPQYILTLRTVQLQAHQYQAIQGVAQLTGGWLRVQATQQQHSSTSRQSFLLRLTSQHTGFMQVGSFQAVSQSTQKWLSSLGIIEQNSVTLQPINSGFSARLRPAGKGSVHIRLMPWLQSARSKQHFNGHSEVLIGLGSTKQPQQSPSNQGDLRLYGQNSVNQGNRITIASASTEVTLKLGEEVMLMAHDAAANQFGKALLSNYSGAKIEHLSILLSVQKL